MIYNIKEYNFNLINSKLKIYNKNNILFNYIIKYKIGSGSLSNVYLLDKEINLYNKVKNFLLYLFNYNININNKYILKLSKDNNNYIIEELNYINNIFIKNNIKNICYPIQYGYINNIDKYYIIYPYFGNYNLENIKLFNLNNNEKLNIINQIISQLNNLNNCIHCDLKPSNIVIDNNKNVTIIDFGLIKELSDIKNILSTSYITSPESILSIDYLHLLIDDNDVIDYSKHDYYGLFFIILNILLNNNFYYIFYNYLYKLKIIKYIESPYIYIYCWYKFYYDNINNIEIKSLQNLIKYILCEYPEFSKIKFYNFNKFYDIYININNNKIKDFIYYLIHFNYNKRKLLLNNLISI